MDGSKQSTLYSLLDASHNLSRSLVHLQRHSCDFKNATKEELYSILLLVNQVQESLLHLLVRLRCGEDEKDSDSLMMIREFQKHLLSVRLGISPSSTTK